MVFHAFPRMYLKAIALHSGIRLTFPCLSKLTRKCLSSARLAPRDYCPPAICRDEHSL